MGTDAIGYTLAILAIGSTMVAVRARYLLTSLGASALWASLMAFILANTTAGLNWQVIFVLSAITFIGAMFLVGVGRGMYKQEPGVTDYGRSHASIIGNIRRQFQGEDYRASSRNARREENLSEYKALVHRKARGTQPRRRTSNARMVSRTR